MDVCFQVSSSNHGQFGMGGTVHSVPSISFEVCTETATCRRMRCAKANASLRDGAVGKLGPHASARTALHVPCITHAQRQMHLSCGPSADRNTQHLRNIYNKFNLFLNIGN